MLTKIFFIVSFDNSFPPGKSCMNKLSPFKSKKFKSLTQFLDCLNFDSSSAITKLAKFKFDKILKTVLLSTWLLYDWKFDKMQDGKTEQF